MSDRDELIQVPRWMVRHAIESALAELSESYYCATWHRNIDRDAWLWTFIDECDSAPFPALRKMAEALDEWPIDDDECGIRWVFLDEARELFG